MLSEGGGGVERAGAARQQLRLFDGVGACEEATRMMGLSCGWGTTWITLDFHLNLLRLCETKTGTLEDDTNRPRERSSVAFLRTTRNGRREGKKEGRLFR